MPPLSLRHIVPDEAQYQAELEGCNDARTGMLLGIPRSAMCVQRFDDSLNSAIHITYRISLRSSSMPEPRDPLLKVLIHFEFLLRAVRNTSARGLQKEFGWFLRRAPGSGAFTHPGRDPAEATVW